jgi:crotonobetainyl-CoA:carnitine CoA-transferase CaiB-like acyl-CoA transferase
MLLQGLKVVEFSTWVAGPGCAAILADWGADVVKVESAAGDPTRGFYPDSADSPGNPVFSLENRGKRAIVLNTAHPDGRDALLAVLREADVFVTNLRPGALKRARIDHETLRLEFPRLIYASVSGYGLQGADADLPAFDLTGFWTRSGIAASTIPPDQEPFPCRPGFGDHVTALATTSAVLAALHERSATGLGRLVETSLIRTGAYAIGWDLSVQLRYGEVATAQKRHDRPAATSGFFRSRDNRWFCMVPRGPACFANIMSAIRRPDLAVDPRFAALFENLTAVRELREILDQAFAKLNLAEIAERLRTAEVIWSPMATLAEMSADPQVLAAGCVVETPDGWGGTFPSPATPARFPGLAHGPAGPAPRLGQHTRQVLAEAGLTSEQIEKLIDAGLATDAAGA